MWGHHSTYDRWADRWGWHPQSLNFYQNLDRNNCTFFILRFIKLLESVSLLLSSNMGKFWLLFLQIFFPSTLSLAFLRNSNYMYRRPLEFHRLLMLCYFWGVFLFSVFHYGYSITISSNPIIFCFIIANLLLISYRVFFILDTYLKIQGDKNPDLQSTLTLCLWLCLCLSEQFCPFQYFSLWILGALACQPSSSVSLR